MIDWMTRESVRGCAPRNLCVILDGHADFNRRRGSQDSRARGENKSRLKFITARENPAVSNDRPSLVENLIERGTRVRSDSNGSRKEIKGETQFGGNDNSLPPRAMPDSIHASRHVSTLRIVSDPGRNLERRPR